MIVNTVRTVKSISKDVKKWDGYPLGALFFIIFCCVSVTLFLTSCSKNKKDVTEVLGPGMSAGSGAIAGKVTTTSYQPISGVTVWTELASSLASSGNDGKYTLRGVTAGNYTVKAWKTGYDIKSETTTVVAGETATVNIKLSPATSTGTGAGEISGVVMSETSSPVPNARVWTEPASSTVYADNYGNYKISNVSAGTYTLKADMGGMQTAVPVTIAAGQKLVINLMISFTGGGGGGGGSGTATVSGQVMSGGGPPPAPPPTPADGALVFTVPATFQTTSAGGGYYTLSNIPASSTGTSYILKASKDGKVGQVNITVYPGQTLTGIMIGIPP